MNDARIFDRAKFFKLIRANGEGAVQAEMELFVSQHYGTPEDFYKAVERNSADKWKEDWNRFISRIKHTIGLDDTNELAHATREYNRVTLAKNASVDDVVAFPGALLDAKGRHD